MFGGVVTASTPIKENVLRHEVSLQDELDFVGKFKRPSHENLICDLSSASSVPLPCAKRVGKS